MDGGVVSTTDTTKLELALLPALSVAWHDTVVSPSANVLPEAGAQLTATAPSTMSLAVGTAYVTLAPFGPVASAVSFACDAMLGGVVSTTVTLKLAFAALPATSVAEHETVVGPRA